MNAGGWITFDGRLWWAWWPDGNTATAWPTREQAEACLERRAEYLAERAAVVREGTQQP